MTAAGARLLITRFGVHVERVACLPDDPGLTLASCGVEGLLLRSPLEIVVTVVHPPHPDERSGTQVMFFAPGSD